MNIGGDMIDYIRFKINKIENNLSKAEQTKLLLDIYKDLEERGYTDRQTASMINSVISDNLMRLVNESLKLMREIERLNKEDNDGNC